MRDLARIVSLLVLAVCFYLPAASEAAPLTIEASNLASLSQYNECLDCGGIEQLNVALIYQEIRLGPEWYATENSWIFGELLNLAFIEQDNICEGCGDVIQFNGLTVNQWIQEPPVFPTSTPGAGPFPEILANLALVDQSNLCDTCGESSQLNVAEITQFITLYRPFVLPEGESLVSHLNFASIIQTNYCSNCDGVAQLNLASITQSIQPVPEPSSVLLMVSGLAALCFWRMRQNDWLLARN